VRPVPNRFGGAKVAGAMPRQVVSVPRRTPEAGALSTRAVGSYIPRLTRKAFEKYGFSAAALITDWVAIVGADLARCAEPERLKWPTGVQIYDETDNEARGRPGATLVLRVDPARALDIQYKARQIIDRINAYFGYSAVSTLRLVQGQLGITANTRPKPAESKTPEVPELADIADAALRGALQRMAHGIVMRGEHRRISRSAR
jgi:hypothetical protein